MNLDELAYPEIIYIDDHEYNAQRDMNKSTVYIPYTIEPNIGIGDVITQKSGQRKISLKVLDAQFSKDSTLQIGTIHRHLITLKVENTTSLAHKTPLPSSNINIGSITGEQVQIGNDNSQTVNISIQQLVEELAKSQDEEAKSLLKKLLDNSTVGSLIGASASGLMALL